MSFQNCVCTLNPLHSLTVMKDLFSLFLEKTKINNYSDLMHFWAVQVHKDLTAVEIIISIVVMKL